MGGKDEDSAEDEDESVQNSQLLSTYLALSKTVLSLNSYQNSSIDSSFCRNELMKRKTDILMSQMREEMFERRAKEKRAMGWRKEIHFPVARQLCQTTELTELMDFAPLGPSILKPDLKRR